MRGLYHWIFCGVLFALGCGTNTGNPGMPQPEEIETTTSAQIELPEFEFSYPDAFIGDDGGFDLVAKQSCSNILTCSVLRGHRKVSRVKKLINRLKKQDKIDRKGGFAKKGPKGRISGDIEALEGDEKGYDFKGTVCLDQKLMMVFYWNKDQTKLQFVSDLNSSPFDDDEAIHKEPGQVLDSFIVVKRA